jgi:AraC family transcriptional regulator
MEPRFIELPEKKVVGLGAKFISIRSPERNNSTVIPALWDRFIKRIGAIPNKIGRGAMGLVEELPAAERSHPDELLYIAGAEVSSFEGAPAGMVHRVIPAGRYALFTHKGKLSGLERTMNYICGQWMPSCGLRFRKEAQLEVYDERFNPGSDDSEFDILVAV